MNCDKTWNDLNGIETPYEAGRDRCPVDYSLRLIRRLRVGLCGKGVFCRDGAAQIEQILTDILAGEGKGGDTALLREVCSAMETLADCGLSKKAAAQIAALLDAEPETWEAHITRRRCPSLVCGRLTLHYIDPNACTGCGKCIAVCPENAIEGGDGMIHIISRELCTGCGLCIAACSDGAIKRADVAGVPPKVPAEPVPVGSFKTVAPGSGLRKGLRK